MGNINKAKIIRIFGATIAGEDGRTRAYGNGRVSFIINGKKEWIEYVDYFIDDLVILIKKQKLEKVFIKKLT